MFGFQRRLVRRCEWLRRMPKIGFLPHTSQTDAIDTTSLVNVGTGLDRGQQWHRERLSDRSTIRSRCRPSTQLGAADLRQAVAALPRRAARPPGGAEPAQRLPGARRRHRHEHGAHPRVGRARSSATAESMAEVCQAISRGSLMGARGNSGVILSQILRGLADDVPRARRGRPRPTLVAGLRRAADAAYEAVHAPGRGHDPHRRARGGRGGRGARDGATLAGGVLDAAPAAAARRRSRSTPELLPGPARRRRRRRGRQGLHAAARRVPRGRRRPADPRARGRRRRRASVEAHLARRRRRRRCATRSCTSSTPTTTTIPAFKRRVGRARRLDRRRRRRRPLELPRAHRRHRRRDRSRHRRGPARARSASPTCSSRSRRSAGCARPTVRRRPRRARRAPRSSRPRSSRSASATASAACSRASACSTSSPAGSR